MILLKVQVDELFRRAERQEGYSLSIDLSAQTITDGNGFNAHFEIAEFRKHILLEGLDDIGMTLKHQSRIAEYEESHHPGARMYTPVDSKYASPK